MALQEVTPSSSVPASSSSPASPAFPTPSRLDPPSTYLPSPLGASSAGPAPDNPISPRFFSPRAISPPSLWARVERTINSLCHNRWLGLICGLWLLACAGSSATFAIYSPALKAVGGYNQRQVDGLAVAKDMGESVGLLPGLLCDALPVWALVLVGSLHYLVGFSGLFAVATQRIMPLPFWQSYDSLLSDISRVSSLADLQSYFARGGGGGGGSALGMPMPMGMGMGGSGSMGGGGGMGGASGAYWATEGSSGSSMGAGGGSSGVFLAVQGMGGSSSPKGSQQAGSSSSTGGYYYPPPGSIPSSSFSSASSSSALSLAPPRARPVFSQSTFSPPAPAFTIGASPPAPSLTLAAPSASSAAAPAASAAAAPTVPSAGASHTSGTATAAAPSLRSPVGLAAALAPASQRFSSLRPSAQGGSSDSARMGAPASPSLGAGGAGDVLREPLLMRQQQEEEGEGERRGAGTIAGAPTVTTPGAAAAAAGPPTLPSPPPTTAAASHFSFLSRCLPASCWPLRPSTSLPTQQQLQQQRSHHHHTEEERRRKQAELLLAVGEGAVRVGGGRRRSGPRRGQDFTLQQAAVKADFWLLFVSFLCGTGSGLTAINNLAQMGAAQGYSSVRVFLSLLSVSNFVGRLLAGYASEHVVKDHMMPRPLLLLLAQALMAIGHIFFALAFPSSLHLGSVIVGLCYGVHWSIMPATASEIFGLKHFGMLYNTLTAACPMGSFVFSGMIAGYLYDRESEKDHGGGGGGGGGRVGGGWGFNGAWPWSGVNAAASAAGVGGVEGLAGAGGASPAVAHTVVSASDSLSRRILRATSEILLHGNSSSASSSSSVVTQSMSTVGSGGLHGAEWGVSDKVEECYGAHCFRLTFFIMAAVCLLGVCLNLILILRTRVVYASLYAQPDAKAQKEEAEVRAAAREVVSAAAAAARRARRSSLSLCLPFDLCSQSCSSSDCSSPAALIFPAHPGEPLIRYVPTGHTLGRGAFGTVRVCRDSATGGEVAVKTISKRVLALDNPEFADDLRQEVAIMRLVSRSEVSGVVRLLDVRESRDHVHLVMERCNAGSLSALIKSRQRLPEHEAADVIRQLLTTVAGLHNIGVIHRDLKPENVLLCCCNTSCVSTADCQTCSRTGIHAISGVSSSSGDTAREDSAESGRRRSEDSSCSSSESGSTSGSPRVPSCLSGGSCDDSACSNGGCSWPSSRGGARTLCHWSVKLADFGLAVRLPAPSAQIRGVAGTAFYMAPEVARGRLYGREADMWSLGVVLHVLLSGRLPFYGRTEDETRKKACAGHVVFSEKYWAGVSGAARQAVLQMLTVEPRWRATAEQVLHCDWLRETGQC
ncbi:unnamed protein product [Closterium sp. NIES-53]